MVNYDPHEELRHLDAAPRPVLWPIKAALLVLLLGAVALIFLWPREAQGQVSTHPEFTVHFHT